MKVRGKRQNEPVEVSFTIKKAFADALSYMADEDFRSKDEELAWLIEKERVRRTVWKRQEYDTQTAALLRAQFALQNIVRMAEDEVDYEQISKMAAFGLGGDTPESKESTSPSVS